MGTVDIPDMAIPPEFGGIIRRAGTRMQDQLLR